MRFCDFRVLTVVLGCVATVVADDRDASTYLEHWGRTSANRDPVDLDVYVDRYKDAYSRSVLRFASAFFGPVEAKSLEKSFRWSIVNETASELRLRAVARSHNESANRAVISPTSGVSNEELVAGEPARGDAGSRGHGFEIVFNKRFFEPRLVRCIGDDPQAPREAIERLDDDSMALLEQELDQRRLMVRAGADVVQASAMMVESSDAEADSRLLQILSRWEHASAECKSVEMTFKRFDYDNIFELETRGVGRFVYVAPNRGLYELKGASVIDRADDRRTSVHDRKFSVAAAKPQLFWWNGASVTIVDHRSQTFDELPIPKRLRDDVQAVGSWDVIWQMLAGPQKALPGVVDLRTEEFLKRFQWTIINDDAKEILIEGRPKLAADRRHMSRLDIVLDPETFRTNATRLIDPAGSHETVHVFEYVRMNDSSLDGGQTWTPDLSKFEPVGPPPMAPPAEELPVVPPTQQ